MIEIILNKIRFYFYYILKFFIPEIIFIKKKINWNNLSDSVSNSHISKYSKINSPYKLNDTSVDKYTYIDIHSIISKALIGKFCSIGPNFFCGWGIHPTSGISTSPMFYSSEKQNGFTLSKSNKIEERKSIFIGNDVFIGANVTILDGITVGDGAIIGAGAVVSKDIPPYAIAVGCPIQVIKYRFNENQIQALLRIKWWDFSFEKLQDIELLFFDVDSFINKYDTLYNNNKL